MLQQASSTGMMIAPRRGGPAEARAMNREELFAECLDPRILDRVDGPGDRAVTAIQQGAALLASGEKGIDRLLGKGGDLPALRIEAEGRAVGEDPLDCDEGTRLQRRAGLEGRRIAPCAQDHVLGAVAELHLLKGFPVGGLLACDFLDLGMHLRLLRRVFAGGLLEFGDGEQRHGEILEVEGRESSVES